MLMKTKFTKKRSTKMPVEARQGLSAVSSPNPKARKAMQRLSSKNMTPCEPAVKVSKGRKSIDGPPTSRLMTSDPAIKVPRKQKAAPRIHSSEEMPSASKVSRKRQTTLRTLPKVSVSGVSTSSATSGNVTRLESMVALSPLVAEIRETYHRRRDFLAFEGNMSRQMKSMRRRALMIPKTWPPELREETAADTALIERMLEPFMIAQKPIIQHRKTWEKKLAELAKQLPVYKTFVEPLNGMGAIGLGQIIAETGDLSLYANPAKVWKRMGLAVFNGRSQRKTTDAKLAIEMGYSPRRRSTMFVIGDSLLKKQNPYREVYLERKKTELAKAKAEGLKVVPAAKIPKAKKELYRSEGHIHRRAQRYMEKRLLLNLWRAWRDQSCSDPHLTIVAPKLAA